MLLWFLTYRRIFQFPNVKINELIFLEIIIHIWLNTNY